MKELSKTLLISGLVLLALALTAVLSVNDRGVDVASASSSPQSEPTDVPWMDHSLFPQLAGPFETAQEVTSTCLTCHMTASQQVMATTHWTWQYEDPANGEMVGKANVINNYCINPQSNEPRCTSCHVGYGWKDNSFDFTAEENVDCLICHDRSGTYKKFPTAAGLPAYEDTEWKGNPWPAVDLVAVAQKVGPPTRENCGTCHFYGGGGDGVKHGDLDSSMKNPDFALDVHMDAEGNNFTCQACHTTELHQIAGSVYTVEPDERMACSDCHTDAPHEDAMVNMHTQRISCQACHIPEYARGRTTKMTWDWSAAGQLNEEGAPFITKDENGDPVYDTMKGEFTWASNVVPAYIWFNGEIDYQTIGEVIDPGQVVLINQMMGSAEDENSRIYPVKVFQGMQPYDSVNNTLVVPALFPGGIAGADAYWKSWDWNLAIQAGMDYVGVDYSGEYDFLSTVMYWPITHQVAPAENALTCTDCHSEEGRLDFIALGYSEDDAVKLAAFPPGSAQAEEEQAAEEEPAEEEPAEEVQEATSEPTQPQPTYVPKATFAPPADTLGEVELERTSGLTPLMWIVIIVVVIVLVVVAIAIIVRVSNKNKSKA